MTNEKLLPCGCGEPAIMHENLAGYQVRCKEDCENEWHVTQEQAAHAWNKSRQSSQEWVSVDTPPEQEGVYLLAFVSGGVALGTFERDDDGYWFKDNYDEFDLYGVTHWRDMPKPPTSESEQIL